MVHRLLDRGAIVVGHDHLQVDGFSELRTEIPQVGLDATHVRRIELSDVENV